jgi:hypothetical protein
MEKGTLNAVQSHDDVVALAAGELLLQGKYSFYNPESINGPFGGLEVALVAEAADQEAYGSVTIQTLFGLGSETKLQYSGKATFDGSTGYATVRAMGRGILMAFPDPPRPVAAEIEFTLAPTRDSGTITVQGFLQALPLAATSLHPSDSAPS